MLQQYRRIQLPLVGAILLCLLVGVYLFAAKRVSKPDPSSAISKHTVDTKPEEALKYWTEEKKRKAKPVELPNVKDLKQKKKRPRRPTEEPSSHEA
jgi:hypothetical protein